MKTRPAAIACSVITWSIVAANGANPEPPKPTTTQVAPRAEHAQPTASPADAPTAATRIPNTEAPPPATTTATPTTAAPQPARDARVAFGDIRISRPRFGEIQSAQATDAAGIITVPSNTLGPGETLQHRASREAVERRIAEADAFQREADAQFARTEATLAEDQIRGSTVLFTPFGTRFYAPAFRTSHARLHAPTVTVERFNSDAAIHRFAEAATPPIFRIQEGIDRAVIGNRLDRTAVTTPAPKPRAEHPHPRR